MEFDDFQHWLAIINQERGDTTLSQRKELFMSAMNPLEISIEEMYRDWAGDNTTSALESTRLRHSATWRIIRAYVERGMSDNDIAKRLQTMSGVMHLRATDRKTIAAIRKKGLNGAFD